MAKDDLFGEFQESSDNLEFEEFKRLDYIAKRRKGQKRRQDVLNEVGAVPPLPPEVYEERKKYSNDYVLAHKEIFVNSTGIKPYSEEQILSIKHSQQIFQKGGRVMKAEPRGFAKTSRSCNEGLLGVLEGSVD